VLFDGLYLVRTPSVEPIHKLPFESSAMDETNLLPRLLGLFLSFRICVNVFVLRSNKFNPPPAVPIQRFLFLSSKIILIVLLLKLLLLRGSWV
jgi:hypothetical protein